MVRAVPGAVDQIIDNLSINWMRFICHLLLALLFYARRVIYVTNEPCALPSCATPSVDEPAPLRWPGAAPTGAVEPLMAHRDQLTSKVSKARTDLANARNTVERFSRAHDIWRVTTLVMDENKQAMIEADEFDMDTMLVMFNELRAKQIRTEAEGSADGSVLSPEMRRFISSDSVS